MWKRLLGWLHPPATAAAPGAKGISAACIELPFIQIAEVDDAAPLAGELFLRKFKQPIPDYPRHFVAYHLAADGSRSVVAYVHYLAHGSVYLCGGMCVDAGFYRRLSAGELAQLRAAGSLAEYLLRKTFDMIGPCAAIFGSVGDATARNVDLRAGFIDTGEPHLMVVWRDAAEAQKPGLIAEVKSLGGF